MKKISKITIGRYTLPKLSVFMVAFALIGVVLLFAAHASVLNSIIEPEDGSVSATIGQDSSASGGRYVKFNQSSTGSGLPGTDSTCVFRSAPNAVPAFCDGFNKDWGLDPSGPRNGPLSEVWGASRILGQSAPSYPDPWYPGHFQTCGSTADVLPPNDIRICNNRFYETIYDHHDEVTMAFYPKQPFDFAGRTGTVVFDASSDTHGTHGAWTEFLITDKPYPTPKGAVVSGQGPNMRDGIDIVFGLDKCRGDPNLVSVSSIVITRNFVSQGYGFENWTVDGCVQKTTADAADINHFEVQVSQNSIVVWGTNPGSTQLVKLTHLDNANLSFTKGLIWVNDVRYNASKDGGAPDGDAYPAHQNYHDFAWDNIGFDGPKTYRDLSFDVPNNNAPVSDGGVGLGWGLTNGNNVTLNTVPVYRSKTPDSALVTYNWTAGGTPGTPTQAPSFRLNGGTWHDSTIPLSSAWHTIAVPIPVSEVHDGVNQIEFRFNPGPGNTDWTTIANINVILVNGAPVP